MEQKLKESEEKLKKLNEELEQKIDERTKELKESEGKLQMSEEKYRTLFNSCPDGIAITTLDGKIIDVNQAYLDLLGYTIEELKNINFQLLTPKKWYEAEAEEMRAFMVKGFGSFEKEYIKKDGTIFPISLTGWLIKDKFGNPARIGAFIKDITERKRLEEEQQKKVEEQALLLDNIETQIWYAIDEETYGAVNRARAEFLGLEKKDIQGKKIYEFERKEEAELCIAGNRLAFEEKRQVRTEEWVRNGKGELRLCSILKTPMLDENGNVEYIVCTAEDITERKKMEDASRESEERFRSLVETTSDWIWEVDQNGVYTYSSPKVKDLLGYEPEEVIGKTPFDFMPLDEAEHNARLFRDIIESKKPFKRLENKNLHKNGYYVTLETNGVPIFDSNGNLTGYRGIDRDITERKQAEKDLRESEERFRLAFENAADAIFWADTNTGLIINCNKAAEILLEKKKGEIIGQHQTMLHPPQKTEYFANMFKRNIEHRGYADEEATIITKSGKVIPVRITASTTVIGGKSLIQGIFRDFTERMKAEQKLKKSEEKYRSLFENMTEGFAYHEVIVDQNNKPIDYRYIEINPAFENLTGVKVSELIGKKVTEILPGTENDPADWIGKFGNVGLTGIPLTVEDYSEALDKWYKVSGYSPKKGFFAVTFADITERKKAEEKLKESEQKYRKAYNLAEFYKDLFAHDISNILQNILSSIELNLMYLNNPNKQIETMNILNVIKNQVKRGANLVSNVRKLSEIEEKYIDIKPTDVCQVLKTAINFMRQNFRENVINIQIDTISEELYGKANDLLLNVQENILFNAIQHNANSTIEILIKIAKHQVEGRNYLKMEFIDNGLGIADERKKEIFQREIKEDKSVSGIGLGLLLVKRIIESYDGQIWVEDKIKGDYTQGSNFIILIPEAV